MGKMAQEISEVDFIVNSLNEIQEDTTVPRNVRMQIQGIIANLKTEMELQIKINKALNGLDEMANDVNLESYTRQQIWNVMSTLEKLHNL